MSSAIPSRHPAVVLRSQHNHLRNLLAIAMIAVVGLSIAVVVVSSDDAPPSPSDVTYRDASQRQVRGKYSKH